jgi:hypothetical protein
VEILEDAAELCATCAEMEPTTRIELVTCRLQIRDSEAL